MDRLKCSLPTCPPGSTTTSYFECWVPHETTRGPKGPRRLDAAVPAPCDVPEQAGEVRALELIKVCKLDQMRLWNEMMVREHPQGAGPLVGAQMRYLIGSEHGWLGGLGFGASAIKLADRDRWIGWDVSQQRAHLHRAIGMSRFLIRPSVRCHNLASRVLGMTLRAIAADFQAQYNYRPGWSRASSTATSSPAPATRPPTGWPWARPRDVDARTARI